MRKLSPAYRDQIIQLSKDGQTTRQIAATLGLSKSCEAILILTTIGRKRAKSPLRSLDRLGLRDEDVAALYESTPSCLALSRQLGIGREPIRQALHRLGKMPIADGRVEHEGYIMVRRPGHPSASSWGYVREHVIVWEEAHQQRLPKGWVIHHMNGDKKDNRLNNLIALSHKHHAHILEETSRRIKLLEEREVQLEAEAVLLRGFIGERRAIVSPATL